MWFLSKTQKRVYAGLDQGESSLKIVLFQSNGNGAFLKSADCLQGNTIPSMETIKQLDRTAIAMPPSRVTIDYFTLPDIAPDDLQKMVALEMAKKLEYRHEDAMIDYTRSVDVESRDGKFVRLVAFACRKSDVNALTRQWAKFNVTVDFVDVVPMALMNALAESEPNFNRAAIIGIDLGVSKANIIIAKNGALLFTRSFSYHRPGPNPGQDEIAALVSHLVFEIARTNEYCKIHISPVEIDKVVLCGGGASIPSLCENLTAELKLRCEKINLLNTVFANHGQGMSMRIDDDQTPRMAIAAGLACRTRNEAL